jgi:hypothetical protein
MNKNRLRNQENNLKNSELIIVIFCLVTLLVIVGSLTDYSLLWTTVAGIIGGLLGLFIVRLFKK